YRTRSAPILQLTTFYFIEYNWQMNQYTIYVDFSDSKDLDGRIVRYMWNFGDGETFTSTVPYVTHTYYTVPTSSYTFTYTTYTLTLTAFDNDGFYSYINILIPLPATPEILTIPEEPPIEIPKILPVAKITGDTTRVARVNQPITFDCSDSYDPDGEIVEVFWWFGDYDTSISSGSFNDFKTVSHTYLDADTFTVYLYVLDNDFLYSSATVNVIVRGYPTVEITSSKNIIKNKTVVLGYAEPLELVGVAKYPNGNIVGYVWDLGDGNIIFSTSPVINYTYNSVTSSYNVILEVLGDDGLTSTDSVKVIVSARPVIDIMAPVDGKVGEPLTFDASSSLDIDGSIVSYVWSFGDGTSASGKIVTHMYNREGSYKVTLVVTDNVGLTSAKEFVINISRKTIKEEEISYLDKNSLNIYPVPCRITHRNLNISYYLAEDADVWIVIYDIFGRIIKNFEFVKGSIGGMQGWNSIVWDGIGNDNDFVPSGVYVCKILAKNKTKKELTQKFIVFR
ncbi:MAG: PKD domain-containing protein, partial [Elusimicrobiota bacterium]|nr:PKD domain-containing protein [Endomicrobiia bacterium]MDW8165662.1 PKD domain-containing protein [Elusimicrobiota bacterium]